MAGGQAVRRSGLKLGMRGGQTLDCMGPQRTYKEAGLGRYEDTGEE